MNNTDVSLFSYYFGYFFEILDKFTNFLIEYTYLGFPLLYWILAGFSFVCVFRFVLSPFFNGGISVTLSDSVKMSGNAWKSANRYNDSHNFKL